MTASATTKTSAGGSSAAAGRMRGRQRVCRSREQRQQHPRVQRAAEHADGQRDERTRAGHRGPRRPGRQAGAEGERGQRLARAYGRGQGAAGRRRQPRRRRGHRPAGEQQAAQGEQHQREHARRRKLPQDRRPGRVVAQRRGDEFATGDAGGQRQAGPGAGGQRRAGHQGHEGLPPQAGADDGHGQRAEQRRGQQQAVQPVTAEQVGGDGAQVRQRDTDGDAGRQRLDGPGAQQRLGPAYHVGAVPVGRVQPQQPPPGAPRRPQRPARRRLPLRECLRVEGRVGAVGAGHGRAHVGVVFPGADHRGPDEPEQGDRDGEPPPDGPQQGGRPDSHERQQRHGHHQHERPAAEQRQDGAVDVAVAQVGEFVPDHRPQRQQAVVAGVVQQSPVEAYVVVGAAAEGPAARPGAVRVDDEAGRPGQLRLVDQPRDLPRRDRVDGRVEGSQPLPADQPTRVPPVADEHRGRHQCRRAQAYPRPADVDRRVAGQVAVGDPLRRPGRGGGVGGDDAPPVAALPAGQAAGHGVVGVGGGAEGERHQQQEQRGGRGREGERVQPCPVGGRVRYGRAFHRCTSAAARSAARASGAPRSAARRAASALIRSSWPGGIGGAMLSSPTAGPRNGHQPAAR